MCPDSPSLPGGTHGHTFLAVDSPETGTPVPVWSATHRLDTKLQRRTHHHTGGRGRARIRPPCLEWRTRVHIHRRPAPRTTPLRGTGSLEIAATCPPPPHPGAERHTGTLLPRRLLERSGHRSPNLRPKSSARSLRDHAGADELAGGQPPPGAACAATYTTARCMPGGEDSPLVSPGNAEDRPQAPPRGSSQLPMALGRAPPLGKGRRQHRLSLPASTGTSPAQGASGGRAGINRPHRQIHRRAPPSFPMNTAHSILMSASRHVQPEPSRMLPPARRPFMNQHGLTGPEIHRVIHEKAHLPFPHIPQAATSRLAAGPDNL